MCVLSLCLFPENGTTSKNVNFRSKFHIFVSGDQFAHHLIILTSYYTLKINLCTTFSKISYCDMREVTCWITQISLGATSIFPNSVVMCNTPVWGTIKKSPSELYRPKNCWFETHFCGKLKDCSGGSECWKHLNTKLFKVQISNIYRKYVYKCLYFMVSMAFSPSIFYKMSLLLPWCNYLVKKKIMLEPWRGNLLIF